MKKLLSLFAYLVAGATIVGFTFSAAPALLNKPHLTKVAGLAGVAIGAVAGLAVGARRNFR